MLRRRDSAAYSATRRRGRRATVTRLLESNATATSGEKSNSRAVDEVRLVVKEKTTYARLMRAEATQQRVGTTTFIFYLPDVDFTELQIEDSIRMDNDKYEVISSTIEGERGLIVTAEQIV